MIYQNLICTWNVIDDSHKILLGNCLIIFGVIGLALNLWLFVTFLRSDFLISKSYLFLLAICITDIIRAILILPFSSISALFTRWIFGYGMCQLTAFLKLLLGFLQTLILAMIAVERLLSVNYYQKEKQIEFSLYLALIVIGYFASTIIASLPLVQIGNYIYDTSCTACELDWKMKSGPQARFNITVIVLGGIIPAIMMLISLSIALSKEHYILTRRRYEERALTKCMAIMIILMGLFWFPRILLIFWIPFVQNRIPKALAVMAPLGVEAATIVPVLTYLVYLPALRNALITILAKKRRRNIQ